MQAITSGLKLASIVLLAALVLLPPAARARQIGSEKRPPNFIVMMADDLGAHELGCYGHPRHRTPNLDRLARTGIQFDTCYSTPICHPTRFEIMTGQYGHHNQVYHFPGRRGGPPNSSSNRLLVMVRPVA